MRLCSSPWAKWPTATVWRSEAPGLSRSLFRKKGSSPSLTALYKTRVAVALLGLPGPCQGQLAALSYQPNPSCQRVGT